MQCGISGFRRSRNVLLPRKRYPLCSRGLCRNICRRCCRLRVMTCRMLSVCSCCGSRDSVPAHVIFPQCGLSNAGGSTRCFASAVHRCFSNCGGLCRGCVKKKSGPNLGRVLDKERGIYQSKERGIFTFDLATNTYGKPPQSYVSNVRRKNAREKLIVDYGDAFLFDSLLDKFGLRQALQSLGYGNPDSLGALLLYYILQKRSNLHAATWYEGSFARILYPKANLTSQRISDLLESIGKEDNMRAFFNAYLSVLT